jgi:hypothetical protein
LPTNTVFIIAANFIGRYWNCRSRFKLPSFQMVRDLIVGSDWWQTLWRSALVFKFILKMKYIYIIKQQKIIYFYEPISVKKLHYKKRKKKYSKIKSFRCSLHILNFTLARISYCCLYSLRQNCSLSLSCFLHICMVLTHPVNEVPDTSTT